jgi:hypothetical protein
MKSSNKYILCLTFALAFLAGCNTDELQELNVNPQTVNEIDLNFLFSAAELGAASAGSAGDNRYIDWRTNIGMTAYAIQHLACGDCPGGISPGDKYQHNAETAAAPFEFIYGDQLKNIAEILKQTGPGGYDEGNKTNMRNATRILRAFLFHRLTDYYGNIPYFEANTATDIVNGAKFPKYDKQSVIYADLLKELDEAAAGMGVPDPLDGFQAADFIYDGDVSLWKKWAYSLMLRLAMRISNADPAMANTYVAKAIAGGVFTSNADNAVVPMAITPSLWTNQNGISRAFIPGDGGQPSYLSKTLVDYLKGTNKASTADDDPRLMIISGGIGVWTATSWEPKNVNPLEQKGPPNGLDATQLDAYEGKPVSSTTGLASEYSRINVKMLDRDEPYMLMNYGEVELLLAEASERSIGGLTPAAAQAHYEAGVKASMQMYTLYDPTLIVTDAQVASYLATYPYAGTTEEKLEMIGEQLWVNHFLNWWEAWSDYRRTGYPKLVPVNFGGNETGGTIPQRLRYPTSEVGGNPNFQAGATTPDLYTTRVWWAGGAD